MRVKVRRTVDDIFDDLDNIGKRKPSLVELYPDEFDASSSRVDEPANTSPAPNQRRTHTGSCAQSQTPPAGDVTGLDSSCQRTRHAVATPMTICGSPTFSDIDAADSPAFASELTTKHRRAEGAADLAVFLADSVHRSPTPLGLQQVVDHLCAFEGRFVIRAICVGGLARPFLHGLLKDYRYESLRGAEYTKHLLMLLRIMLAHIPHDSVPMEDVFEKLIRVVAPSVCQLTTDPVSPPVVLPNKASTSVSFAASVARVAQKRARDESESQSLPSHGAGADDAAATMQLATAVRNLGIQLGDSDKGETEENVQCSATAGASAAPNSNSAAIEAQALEIMTELLLSLNNQASEGEDGFAVRSLSNLISKSTAAYFVNARGLEGILQYLTNVVTRTASSTTCSMEAVVVALRLIVLVTCDPGFVTAVAPHRDGEHLRTLGHLMKLAIRVDDWCGDNVDIQTEAVRVCINITSALPSLIPKTRTALLEDACHRIQRSVKELDAQVTSAVRSPSTSTLVDDGDGGYDVATLRICLSINLLQRGRNTQMVRTLTRLGDDEPEEVLGSSFLARAASLMVRWYEAEDTDRSVVAGYLAMMLACISLCEEAEVDFRVAVITAIARALATASRAQTIQSATPQDDDGESEDTPTSSQCTASSVSGPTVKGKQLKAKPMMLVVAVLQEFIMFQSAAGILTKEVLISMHQVIEKLIERNNIVVERE